MTGIIDMKILAEFAGQAAHPKSAVPSARSSDVNRLSSFRAYLRKDVAGYIKMQSALIGLCALHAASFGAPCIYEEAKKVFTDNLGSS